MFELTDIFENFFSLLYYCYAENCTDASDIVIMGSKLLLLYYLRCGRWLDFVCNRQHDISGG